MQRFFFPSIGLSQAGRLGGEIQMIKYTKIALFSKVRYQIPKFILDSLRQFWWVFG